MTLNEKALALAREILDKLGISAAVTIHGEDLGIATIVICEVISKEQYDALVTASREVSYLVSPGEVKVSITFGMVNTGTVNSDEIIRRFKSTGIKVTKCIVNDTVNRVELTAKISDAPEKRQEQGRALGQVMKYVAPMLLVINDKEVSLNP